MTREERVWLVEWRGRDGFVEPSWPGEWEPDHNSGIWFSREGAQAQLARRAAEFPQYQMRVRAWVPAPEEVPK